MNYSPQDIATILSGDALGRVEQTSAEAKANVSQFDRSKTLIERLNQIISGAESKAGEGSLLTSLASSSVFSPLLAASILAIPGVGTALGPTVVNALAGFGAGYGTEKLRQGATNWDENILQFIKDNEGTKIGQIASDEYNQLKLGMDDSATTGALFDAVAGGIFPSSAGDASNMFGTKEITKQVGEETVKEVVPRTIKDFLLDDQGILTGYTKGSDKGILKNIVEGVKNIPEELKEFFPKIDFEKGSGAINISPKGVNLNVGLPKATVTKGKSIDSFLKDIIPGDIDKTGQALSKAPGNILDFIKKIDPVEAELPSFFEGILGKSLGLDKTTLKESGKFVSENPNMVKILKSLAPTLVSHNFSLDPNYSPIKYLTGEFSKPQFRNPYGSIGGY